MFDDAKLPDGEIEGVDLVLTGGCSNRERDQRFLTHGLSRSVPVVVTVSTLPPGISTSTLCHLSNSAESSLA